LQHQFGLARGFIAIERRGGMRQRAAHRFGHGLPNGQRQSTSFSVQLRKSAAGGTVQDRPE
jgi:hypothetical protein